MCRLVCGDVRGRFVQLFTRVSNIQKKAGQFDVIWTLLAFFNNTLYVFHCDAKHLMACAVATSCCISNVPFQWEKQNFDPTVPTFLTDLSKTQN